MLNKIIYALGLATALYLVEAAAYNVGTTEAVKKVRKYAEEHPNETFKEFLENLEREEV